MLNEALRVAKLRILLLYNFQVWADPIRGLTTGVVYMSIPYLFASQESHSSRWWFHMFFIFTLGEID